MVFPAFYGCWRRRMTPCWLRPNTDAERVSGHCVRHHPSTNTAGYPFGGPFTVEPAGERGTAGDDSFQDPIVPSFRSPVARGTGRLLANAEALASPQWIPAAKVNICQKIARAFIGIFNVGWQKNISPRRKDLLPHGMFLI